MIEVIKIKDADEVWEDIKHWVKLALGVDRTSTVDDVKRYCEHSNLWVIKLDGEYTGFFMADIINTPQGKMCYAPWLGGESLELWVSEGFRVIEEWMKENECISYSFIGRKAWKRLLGFDYEGVYYYKNLR